MYKNYKETIVLHKSYLLSFTLTIETIDKMNNNNSFGEKQDTDFMGVQFHF